MYSLKQASLLSIDRHPWILIKDGSIHGGNMFSMIIHINDALAILFIYSWKPIQF